MVQQWWNSWVGVAMVVVDVGGSGYGFVGVGGGGLLIGPLFGFVGLNFLLFFIYFCIWLLVFWLSLRLP